MTLRRKLLEEAEKVLDEHGRILEYRFSRCLSAAEELEFKAFLFEKYVLGVNS